MPPNLSVLQPSSRLLLCSIKCRLGCGKEVQEYQAEGDAADRAYEKERRDVALNGESV